ncbi:MAG TPA: hypothetical protein DD377_00770 [Firmicutes bacterium]|nr:hypothetical protein [Bacillota bacterium]
MASKTFNERYTDEEYVSKRELADKLRLNLVDSMWSGILAYRKQFAKPLTGITLITKQKMYLTSTQALYDKYSEFETKLSYFQTEYVKTCLDKDSEKEINKYAYLLILKLCCQALKINASELSLKAIVNGVYRDTDPSLTYINAYYKAISSFDDAPSYTDGLDFLGHEYSILKGTNELTSFYRNSDSKSIYVRSVVSKVYESAPANEIPDLIDSLLSFEKLDNKKGFLKALIIEYFINYIKPFDDNNLLMGVLLSKWCLSRANLTNVASILPFEAAFIPSNRLNDYFESIQQTGDVTYFLMYAMEKISPLLDELLDQMHQINKNIIKKEHFDKEKIEMETSPVIEEIKEERKESEVQKKEEKTEKKVSSIERIDPYKFAKGNANLALLPPKSGLSEKEIKETARYIVETNPNIKKAQAYFFAGHSTIGRYYTIQDYKKVTRCAYETARTSMDLLAEQGFYRKLQVKNKFVYTPIEQGEK